MFRVRVNVGLCLRAQEACGHQVAAEKAKVRFRPTSIDIKICAGRLIPTLPGPRPELRWTVCYRRGEASYPYEANHSGYVFGTGNHRIPAIDMNPGLSKTQAFEAAVLSGVNEIRSVSFPAT